MHEGKNRWYHDGYNARLNGKHRDANPRLQTLPFALGRIQRWTKKAERWDEGWEAADTHIRGMTNWDYEQDLINQLIKETSNG